MYTQQDIVNQLFFINSEEFEQHIIQLYSNVDIDEINTPVEYLSELYDTLIGEMQADIDMAKLEYEYEY